MLAEAALGVVSRRSPVVLKTKFNDESFTVERQLLTRDLASPVQRIAFCYVQRVDDHVLVGILCDRSIVALEGDDEPSARWFALQHVLAEETIRSVETLDAFD